MSLFCRRNNPVRAVQQPVNHILSLINNSDFKKPAPREIILNSPVIQKTLKPAAKEEQIKGRCT